MTLHWWMHWFWVTLIITIAISGTSLAAPQSEEIQPISSETETELTTNRPERQGRAMYFSKPTPTTKPFIINITDNDTETSMEALPLPSGNLNNETKDLEISHPAVISSQINDTDLLTTTMLPTSQNVNQTPLAPIVTPKAETSKPNIINMTESNTTVGIKKKNMTREDAIKDETSEGVVESRIVTEKPLSLETNYLQTRIPPSGPNLESYRRVIDEGGMDTGAIAGISFAALVLAGLAGSTAFVLYRRRYLNKPQTFNDKCSNPDSSGYLDDSIVRDNSEEMYSLDNDSFLNSLEAMTIQNYWTDTVKHTKL